MNLCKTGLIVAGMVLMLAACSTGIGVPEPTQKPIPVEKPTS